MRLLALGLTLTTIGALLTGCSGGGVEEKTNNESTPSLAPLTPAATVTQILLGQKAYDAGGNVLTGQMPFGTNFTGTNGLRSIPIPLGYYDGSQTATCADTNLVAGNIVNGTTIFGIIGTAAGQFGMCTDNALNAAQCSTNTSRYVTATAGGNVTGANGSLSAIIPQGYYAGTESATMSDTNLIAANILSGISIFGDISESCG